MKKVNVAIIGFGMAGKLFHLIPLLENKDFDVKMIMTRNKERQKEINDNYQHIKIIETYEEVLLDKEIDLVVIATSNDVHYEYTKKALKHNKHVICEKPFVKAYKEALELFELAKNNNLLLRVFHNRTYDGDLLTIKELLKTKDFGKLISFKSRFNRFSPSIRDNWRSTKVEMAGLYYDLAPHLVHHAVELFGLPKSIYTKLYIDREESIVDDHFEIILNYETGLTCYLSGEVLERNVEPRFEIKGTKASYIKIGFDNPDNLSIIHENIYQDNNLISKVIDNNLLETNIPLYMGRHYLFYEKVFKDIVNKNFDEPETRRALEVILIMEKGILSNNEKKDILISKN